MTTSSRRPFEIIGAEFDSGGRVRGTSLAPKTLREYGLLERLLKVDPSVRDGADVTAPGHSHAPHGRRVGPPEVNDLPAAELFSQALYRHTREVLKRGNRPLVIGGDHSISIATVSAVVDHYQALQGPDSSIGLLWVDAHPDLNTPESSPSGNLHGMVARTLLGEGPAALVSLGDTQPKLKPRQLAQLGLRDVDPPEREYIRSAGITACSMRDIDCLGVYACIRRCLEALASCTTGIYVSFDLDVCDPSIAPGVDTPVRGGLSFREAHLVMELIAEQSNLLGIELVEYDPKFDQSHTSADLAIALLESALGKSIL